MKRKKMIGGVAIVLALALLGIVGSASTAMPLRQSGAPTLVIYQGYLTDASGEAIDGAVNLKFGVYAAESDGTVLWGETHSGVQVSDGYFTAILGSVTPLSSDILGATERWLQVSVDTGGGYTDLPRQQITAAPYALQAQEAAAAPWTGLTDIPAGFADGVDDDTTYTAGAGLNLVDTEFSIASTYRLPQTCSNGQIAEWNNTASQWECGDDDTGGPHDHWGETWTGSGTGLTLSGGSTGLSGSGSSYGVYGVGTGAGSGVYGTGNFGVWGDGSAWGVYGHGNYGVYGSGLNYGVYGDSAYGSGVHGSSYYGTGVYGSGGSYGVYSDGDMHVANDLSVVGNVSKGGGSFKIDHPLDPANKYLYHSFVESPDMMNVYNGNVTLDANGEAWVELPDWFETLNRDFRYQLTCIGGFAHVYIAEEVQDNRFQIAGGESGMTVSWQVTGIRHDPYAEANRIPVEEEKPPEEQGLYLHPVENGKSETLGLDYWRNQGLEPLETEEAFLETPGIPTTGVTQ